MDECALLEACVVGARDAGAEILKLVAAGFEVEVKSDQSPVTACDRAAELIILDALAKAAPGVPVIAEEEVAAGDLPDVDGIIVAEGRADIYPRLSPTAEWDTAAGHAVLLAAGGRVDGLDGTPLRYGKTAFLNRGFCATAGWQAPTIAPFLEPFGGGGDVPQGV